jgi:serine/threonine protein phosphatase PrpC
VAAVFDGHAGKQAADYACSHLVEHIERSEPEWSQGDLEGACRKGFIACDASMREVRDHAVI